MEREKGSSLINGVFKKELLRSGQDTIWCLRSGTGAIINRPADTPFLCSIDVYLIPLKVKRSYSLKKDNVDSLTLIHDAI